VRVAYQYRERPFLCSECRKPERPPPDDRDRAYWLARFSLEEIRELAAAIWPMA
jgi:hypothetical protein